MKRFLNTILRATTDLSFYHRDLPQLPLKTVLTRHCLFVLLVGFCAGLQWSIFTQPKLSKDIQSDLVELTEQLPTDLELVWDGTHLASTPTSFSLEYSAQTATYVQNRDFPELLLQVITETDSPDFALITLTDTNVRIWQAPQEPQVEQLSTLLGSEPMQLTYADVQTQLPETQAFIANVFQALAWIAPIASSILLLVQRLIQAVLTALVLVLIGVLTGNRRTFTTTYAFVILLFIPAELLFFVTERVFSLGYPSIFSTSVVAYYALIVLTRPQVAHSK